MKVHYSGRIDWDGGIVLAGWAACCSGEQAVRIRREKRNSIRLADVTCKKCLRMVEKHDERVKRIREEVVK